MEPFYLSHEEFWEWFNRDPSLDQKIIAKLNAMTGGPSRMASIERTDSIQPNLKSNHTPLFGEENGPEIKKMRTGNSRKPVRSIVETEASMRCDSQYVIMFGKHRPGKKSKVWEGDGYLSLLNGVAHLSDLKGRMLEDPIILDDVDMSLVEDLGELLIGNTEVQVIERNK